MRLALLGAPVAHSRSPAIHDAALAAAGIEGSYEAREVDAAGLARALAELRAGQLDGANVTMPHKRTAAALADELTLRAARSGAVNTLYRRDGTVVGDLTDLEGLHYGWQRAQLPQDAPVLVLGAGGAAAAAIVGLEHRSLHIASRRAQAAVALLAATAVSGAVVGWGTPLTGAVVVNATPLGMRRESLPDDVLEKAAGLFDMAYGADRTPAVAAAIAAGIPAADGLDMLVGQAAASFRIWTGLEAPLDVMRSAAAGAR